MMLINSAFFMLFFARKFVIFVKSLQTMKGKLQDQVQRNLFRPILKEKKLIGHSLKMSFPIFIQKLEDLAFQSALLLDCCF